MRAVLIPMLFAAGLILACPAAEAALVGINDITITEGTTSVQVPILISGGESISDLTIGFSVGDGGPALGGMETILITGVDYTTGTIFEGKTLLTGEAPPLPSQSATTANVAVVPGSGPATADGIAMVFTLDTSTATAGEVLLLDPNAGGVSFSGGTALTFDPGTLRVLAPAAVPEPSSLVLLGLTGVGAVAVRRYRRKPSRSLSEA